MVAALADLAEHDGVPTIAALADRRHWRRYGQESFVALRSNAWDMPARVPIINWLDSFAEMKVVRRAIESNQILSGRVDAMVGTEFSQHYRRLDWLLVEHVLEPIVTARRAYEFDEEVFDLYYSRFETGLLADTVRFVEYIPLNGFTSTMTEVMLPDGFVVREMTDSQMSRAIQVLAAPAELSSAPNSVRVSYLHQRALTATETYPVRSETDGLQGNPKGPNFPRLQEPARRLITALRVVCGGSVVATRSIHDQHDEDFPCDIGGSAMLSAFDNADVARPTVLLGDQVEAVCSVYQTLTDPAVEHDRSLQVALRRFVFAGSKSLPEDRLIDLNICSESLFVKRANVKTRQKGAPAAVAAGQLLGDDPILQLDRMAVERFFRKAYQLRNAEIHGDDPVHMTMTLLSGAETNDLARFVDDLMRLLGRAIQRVLTEVIAAAGVKWPRPSSKRVSGMTAASS